MHVVSGGVSSSDIHSSHHIFSGTTYVYADPNYPTGYYQVIITTFTRYYLFFFLAP